MSDDLQIEQAANDAATNMREEVAERRARSSEETPRRRPLNSPALLVGLGLGLTLFTYLNLTGHGLMPKVAEPTAAELEEGVQQELDLLVMEIESLADSEGEVPVSVDEWIPPGTDSWTYERLGASDFTVSMTLDGQTAVYDTEAR